MLTKFYGKTWLIEKCQADVKKIVEERLILSYYRYFTNLFVWINLK